MTRARRLGVTAVALAAIGASVGAGVGAGCIIPDRGIRVQSGEVNLHAVRFVESIPLEPEAETACDPDEQVCPLPPITGLPTYLDPTNEAFQFCICSENRVDENRLAGVTLFAEDADEDDGEPKDLLYAVLLLDWNPTTGESAFNYVAYRGYLDPREPLNEFFSSYENLVISRPQPFVRSITLQDTDGHFDLCNQAGLDLMPGTHTLTVMVTDRQWFQLTPSVDGETGVESMTIEYEGVPDIADGATYDIETYVFTCLEEGADGCDCVDAEDSG